MDMHQMVESFTDREINNGNVVSGWKLTDSGTRRWSIRQKMNSHFELSLCLHRIYNIISLFCYVKYK